MSEQAPQIINADELLRENHAARAELRAQDERAELAARQEGWLGDQSTEGKTDLELAAQANVLHSYKDYARKGPQSEAAVWNARFEHFDKSGGERIERKGAHELMADYAKALAHDDRTLKEDVLGEVHRRASLLKGKEQVDYLTAYDRRFTGVIDKFSKLELAEIKDPKTVEKAIKTFLTTYEDKAEVARAKRQADKAHERIEAAIEPEKAPKKAKRHAASESTSRPETAKPEPVSDVKATLSPELVSLVLEPLIDPEPVEEPNEFEAFAAELSDAEQEDIAKLNAFLQTIEPGSGFRTHREYKTVLGENPNLSYEKYLTYLSLLEQDGNLASKEFYTHDDGTPKAYWIPDNEGKAAKWGPVTQYEPVAQMPAAVTTRPKAAYLPTGTTTMLEPVKRRPQPGNIDPDEGKTNRELYIKELEKLRNGDDTLMDDGPVAIGSRESIYFRNRRSLKERLARKGKSGPITPKELNARIQSLLDEYDADPTQFNDPDEGNGQQSEARTRRIAKVGTHTAKAALKGAQNLLTTPVETNQIVMPKNPSAKKDSRVRNVVGKIVAPFLETHEQAAKRAATKKRNQARRAAWRAQHSRSH